MKLFDLIFEPKNSDAFPLAKDCMIKSIAKGRLRMYDWVRDILDAFYLGELDDYESLLERDVSTVHFDEKGEVIQINVL